jgi:hypothetical protein
MIWKPRGLRGHETSNHSSRLVDVWMLLPKPSQGPRFNLESPCSLSEVSGLTDRLTNNSDRLGSQSWESALKAPAQHDGRCRRLAAHLTNLK